MTTFTDLSKIEEQVLNLKEGYAIWDSLSPMERYNKVMVNFTPAKRKGVNGMRRMVKYIICNGITK
jgi:hypothetical protein